VVKPTNAPSQTANIKVYPNPATMTLYFEFPSSGLVTIKILDVTGRLIDEQFVDNTSATNFNVSGYMPGVYISRV
jgi:cystathionine beta-lyase/cystathionine gamma-synthase